MTDIENVTTPAPPRPTTSTTSVAGSCQQYQPPRVYTYATERNTWDNTPIHHTGSTTFRGRTARLSFTSHVLAQWKYIGRIPKWKRLYPMQSFARTDAKLCEGDCKALRWWLQSFASEMGKTVTDIISPFFGSYWFKQAGKRKDDVTLWGKKGIS